MRLRRFRRWLALAVLAGASAWIPGPARALDYLDVTVQPDRAVPGVCLSFSSALPRGATGAFDPFVSVEPGVDHSTQARGKELCVTGLQHGGHYKLRLKAGLTAADRSTLPKDVTVDVLVPDRDASVSFEGGKTLLPYTAGIGLPLRSVNVGKARLQIYRFDERALAEAMSSDWFGQAATGYNLGQIAERSHKLFEGTLDIARKPNVQVATTIPIDGLVKALTPGVYVAVAIPDGTTPDDGDDRATQWFSVSDIGLMTVKTDGGLLVSARSLQTAKPQDGVALRLVARSNEVLAAVTTDKEGRAVLPAGLLRGEGGDAPRLLTASGPRGDFTSLQLDAPGLDLGDLKLEGRTPPGPLDAFLWTDRGIYRPGETIHLGVLLRDGRALLVPKVPLTLHLLRPDGIEVDHLIPNLDRAGGGTLDIPVPDNAYSGEWTMWAGAGGKEHVGEVKVSVEDFVPPRLEAKIEGSDETIDAARPVTASVQADYFYGSPGSDLSGQIEATLRAAAHPFADFADYSFGLVEEPVLPKDVPAQTFTTDDKGQAEVTIPLDDVPDTTTPLELALRATVNDLDGRPAVAERARPLRSAGRFIGVRPRFTDGVPENTDAAFDVALLDGDGHPSAPDGLKWSLVKEDYTYNTFFRDGRWQSEPVVIDTPATGGEITLGADGRGKLAVPVSSGRYRLEVFDAAGKTATSVRFGAGWWGGAQADDRKPDVMPVTIEASAPGGTVRARVEPGFAGRVLVMLDGLGLHGVQELEVGKDGATVSFDAADVPASGAYVLALAVSPAGTVVPRLPVRAVGAAWVAGTAAAHKLDVALDAPEVIKPGTTLTVSVSARGAPRDQPVYLTLAGVDEAVLRMTDFDTPDPADWFVGRRAPGFELRDVYGSLIDPAGQPGRLVEGGDARAKQQMGGLDVKTFKTVALFKGPVMLDADGHGTVDLDIPDFSGRLRLMAVAWTVDRYGSAERPVTVRPPLLAELTLPRFLAPGDKAVARVVLTDLGAPEQSYRVDLAADGPLAFDRGDVAFKDVKRDRRRYADRTLTATGALGAARIHMTVTGDDGTTATRDFDLGIRAPNATVTTRQVRTLDPGGRLTAGDALGEGMVPGTAALDVTVSTVPAFDIPGLLAALRRYPYGCAEQTVSRAFPELFAVALGRPSATGPDAPTPQSAVARLYSLQAADGSFGYWSAFDTGNVWLTAYVLDFLQHAEKQGVAVPAGMTSRALTWLAGRFAAAGAEPADVAGNAYAAMVLAAADRLDLSQLRYVSTRAEGHLPSEIARVQLAAALTHAGERDTAALLMGEGAITRDAKVYLNDYGSALRDQAMALSLAAETKLLPPKVLLDRADALAQQAGSTPYLSTQEQVWLLRTAADLKTAGSLDLELDGKPVTDRPSITASVPLGQGRSVDIANKGSALAYLSLATTGVPTGPQPPESNGLSVARSYFHVDGKPADLADVHQTDELVVVVDGSAGTDVQRKLLLVDMLPAGLEPETIGLSGDRDSTSFAWLKDLTEPTFTALRDDRYIAGFDVNEGSKAFKLAYVVRAVTPGTYTRPGTQVEDMYAPAVHARSEAGTLEVKAARHK